MRESEYQTLVIKKLEEIFPGCVVIKNDPTYRQGFPDLTVFYNDRWAVLEVKTSEKARTRPNQEHYVEKLDNMSFAAFIFPDNEEDVLNELQRSFSSRRAARISRS